MTASCPYPLIDGYDGDGIQECAWVPVQHASTAEAAVVWLRRMAPDDVECIEDDGKTIVATGTRSWHSQASCSSCDGSGADEYSYEGDTPIRPFPACETCGGSGRQADDDFVLWESCSPSSPGAVEFWDIEVAECDEIAAEAA